MAMYASGKFNKLNKLVNIVLVAEQIVPECESAEGVRTTVHATGVVTGDVEIPFILLILNLVINRSPVELRARWRGVPVLGKVFPGLDEEMFHQNVFLFIKTGR